MPTKQVDAKIPPQNIDAEMSLLGAILIDDDVLADASEIVKPADFYDQRHQTVFAAMMRLYERHKPVDLLTLTDELKTYQPPRMLVAMPTLLHKKLFAAVSLKQVLILAKWDLTRKHLLPSCSKKPKRNYLMCLISRLNRTW